MLKKENYLATVTSTTVKTLYESCLNYIAKNLALFCDKNVEEGILNFKDKTQKLNSTISEDLIEKLSESNKLNDLNFSLFTSKQTCLKNIKIKNAHLKKSSLKLFKEHIIQELTIQRLTTPHKSNMKSNGDNKNETITFIDLIDSLNSETKKQLRLLDLSHNNCLFNCLYPDINCLSNLSRLNVSNTNFSNLSIDLIAQDLNNLEYLDISATRVSNLQPLLKLKTKLKYLIMYNLKASLNIEMISIISCLNKLIHLDLSTDMPTQLFADLYLNKLDINKFLCETQNSFPDLQVLDISAQADVNELLLM